MFDWHCRSVSLQKLVLFIMRRSQQDEYFTGENIMVMNADTFGSVRLLYCYSWLAIIYVFAGYSKILLILCNSGQYAKQELRRSLRYTTYFYIALFDWNIFWHSQIKSFKLEIKRISRTMPEFFFYQKIVRNFIPIAVNPVWYFFFSLPLLKTSFNVAFS